MAFAVSIAMIPPAPVQAKDGENARTAAVAIAAAALIGTAATSHHDGHYPEGVRYDEARDKAEFERGYRDGLHNASRNNYNKTDAYRHGYKAGVDERDIRISHNQPNRWDKDRHAADNRMQHLATHEAERHWTLPRGSAHPLSSTWNEKNGHYRVKVAAGYHRGVCVFDRDGKIIRFTEKLD
ncbi:hypothetical protein CHL67_07105 [Prosthecochloris sp. GSB1]|uniref:hypothetical protein n=1 Tax=Prosthecochloris sp. GSB1 TaxID=281093 RepID=UPI000B8CDA4A|nr:hypothetical protein [Prosthecochloris sp. GSB1]ASQ90724.1 hypothetical protein CHL67_07105 [Prosthecochloris sp. GSB1]